MNVARTQPHIEGNPAPVNINPSMAPLLWVVFIMVASTSTLWPILTPYAEDLGAGGFELGVVVGAIYATRLVLGPWIGRYGDRHGYRGLLILGTLLYLPIALAYAGANSVWALAGARLLHGVGSAIVLPMVMAVMGEHAGGRSGAAMGRYNAAQWLGYALGPLAGGLIVTQLSTRAVFLLLVPAGLAAALAVLLTDRRLTAPPARPVARAAEPAPGRMQTSLSARLLLLYNFVVAPTSLIVLSFFPLLAGARGYSPVLTGALLSITSFATAAVQPLWGGLADKGGVQPLLLAGGLGALASLALLAGFGAPPIAALATLAAGLAIAGLVAGTSTAAVEAGRRQGMGSFIGLFQSAGSLGQALMPLLYGLLLGSLDISGLLVAVGGLIAASSVLYVVAAARYVRAANVGIPGQDHDIRQA